MKKLIIFTCILLILFLVLTKSLYVEYDELFLILGALTIVSVVYNFSENRESKAKILVSSAVISFFLCWLLCIVDIIIDHFALPKGMEDGISMSMVSKIDEFSEDMILINFICTFFIVIITLITTNFLSWISSRAQ